MQQRERQARAHRRQRRETPEIDGRLHDNAWSNADAATDFIQREPAAGAPATQRTTVSVVYDDAAFLVKASYWMGH